MSDRVDGDTTPRVARVELVAPNSTSATATPHGAQVLGFTDAMGVERLYLSARAQYGDGAAIRGGIPVIFPQFGTGPLPKHGLVRTRKWSVVSHDASHVVFRASDDDTSRAVWPHGWEATLSVALDDALHVTLSARNTGDSAFTFTAALHSYLAVDDIARVTISGLSGLTYTDKVAAGVREVETRDVVTIAAETDRVYEDGPRIVTVHDARGSSATVIEAADFGDWIVWNPWSAMSDTAPDDYRRFVCVEAGRVARPVTLEPGETWSGTVTLRAT